MIGHGQSAGTKTWFVCLKVSLSFLASTCNVYTVYERFHEHGDSLAYT